MTKLDPLRQEPTEHPQQPGEREPVRKDKPTPQVTETLMGRSDHGRYSALMGEPDHGGHSALMGEPDRG